MENGIGMAFNLAAIIAILSIVVTIIISVIRGIHKILTDTKKYELTESFRKELLDWYASVTNLMIGIIHYIKEDRFFKPDFIDKKTEMLSRLSALAEVGRFYFPNVEREIGKSKPSAYQGLRHVNIEFIIQFYNNSNYQKTADIGFLYQMERNFTSVIFDIVDPRKRNQEYAKYLAMTIPEGQSIEDFIYENSKIRSDLFER